MRVCGKTTMRLAALSIGATAMTPALAQDSQPADGGEIVVTALRRDATLQNVPAAITAFNADAIENAGID